MPQPPSRAPLTPMQPMQPRPPSAPMQPLAQMVPMQPLAPLRPGEQRQPVATTDPTFEVAPDLQELPPPAYRPPPQPMYQPPPPPVVNLGLSRLPAPRSPQGWTGAPAPRMPFPTMRRPSGNKAGLVIGVVVALIVGLAAIGSRSSSGGPSFAPISIPSFAVSIPPISIGNSTPGQHHASRPSPPRTPHRTSTLTLNGTISGQRIRVTPLRWVDNARSKDSFFGPSAGKRYFAVEFRVVNTGSVTYVDSPSNGARVIDTKGHKYRTTFAVSGIREGKVFDAAVSVPTGKSAVGYLVFEVPKHARIKQVQFSENSGFGQKGTWTIKRGR